MQEVFDALSDMMIAMPAVWIGVVFVFSLMIGSFLNVVIHRLPIMLEREWHAEAEQIISERQERNSPADADPAAPGSEFPAPTYNLLVPRSACPKCGAMIKAWQNIPVLSYLLLKGKCAHCGTKIPARYPIVELGTAILSATVAWKFGFTWYTSAALVLTWALIALSVIDFDHQILPENINQPLIWLGLLLSLAGTLPQIGLPVDPRSSIIGAATGYLSLWLIYHLFKLLTRKEGMGFGDFKLFAAFGAWLGWQKLPLIILLSAFAGSIVGLALIVVYGRDKNIPIPFGPYLAAAGWIAMLWGDELVGSYMRLSGLK